MKTEAQTEWAAAGRAEVKPPIFEADVAARPDKSINPVDLGTVLPPANWLLLAGGQKVEVEVAALNRGGAVPGAVVNAWYESSPDQKVKANLALSQSIRLMNLAMK
jgi:hypothetical protein